MMTSVAVLLRRVPAPTDEPVFALEDLCVGETTVFYPKSAEPIRRRIVGIYRNYRMNTRPGAAAAGAEDYIRFDDDYLVRAGRVWDSQQWRLARDAL